jgi:multidrug resistance efflux pump
MKALLNSLRRFSLTGVMVLAALWAGYKLWDYYFDAPWTRDGHVRADVVPVAPDVSGFVTDVLVKDNQQVHHGDVLFRIDRAVRDRAEAGRGGAAADHQSQRPLKKLVPSVSSTFM